MWSLGRHHKPSFSSSQYCSMSSMNRRRESALSSGAAVRASFRRVLTPAGGPRPSQLDLWDLSGLEKIERQPCTHTYQGMSGVQGGLGEQKRDILKLREEAGS